MSITVKIDLYQFFFSDIIALIRRTSLLQQSFLFNARNPQVGLFLLDIKTQTHFTEHLIVYQLDRKERLKSILLGNAHQNNSPTVS